MNKIENSDQQTEAPLTAFQLRERKERTCFVGNLPLEITSKKLKTIFKEAGQIEKIWFRSIATAMDSKAPLKAKILKGEFGQQKDNKNGYILFINKDDAAKAKKLFN